MRMGVLIKRATIDPTGGEVYMYKRGKCYIVTIKNNITGYIGFSTKEKTKRIAEKKYRRLIKSTKKYE